MGTLTPISRKPMSLVVGTVAAAGAFLGLFVGTANGSGLMGIVAGAVLLGALAFALTSLWDNESASRWIVLAILVALGFFFGGIPGMVIGALAGWFFGWFIFWLYEGRYRGHLQPYLTSGQVLCFPGDMWRDLCVPDHADPCGDPAEFQRPGFLYLYARDAAL